MDMIAARRFAFFVNLLAGLLGPVRLELNAPPIWNILLSGTSFSTRKGREMRGDEDPRLLEGIMTCREAVFRICLGFSRNASDAEDLSQDAYLKAYRSCARVRHPYLVREWLFRIARTTCLDHLRRRCLARDLERAGHAANIVGPSNPETSAVTDERLRLLETALARLPRGTRSSNAS